MRLFNDPGLRALSVSVLLFSSPAPAVPQDIPPEVPGAPPPTTTTQPTPSAFPTALFDYPERPRLSMVFRLMGAVGQENLGNLAELGGSLLADFSLSEQILDETNRIAPTAVEMLRRSGQNGVLVRYDISRRVTPTGASFSNLTDGQAKIIGAGTTSDAVAWADHLQPQLSARFEDGAQLDARSYSVWISWDESGKIVTRHVSEQERSRMIAFRRNNESLRKASQMEEYQSALSDAISNLENKVRDQEELAIISSIKADIAEDRERLSVIDQKLANELSRQQRLATAVTSLRLMQGILTLAGAVNTWISQTGEAPPVPMQDARSTAEVLAAAEAGGVAQGFTVRMVQTERGVLIESLYRNEDRMIYRAERFSGGPIPEFKLRPR